MENILLFVLTVVIYSFFWLTIEDYNLGFGLARQVKRIALVALLALPLNIGGNVFTIAGNATAEKNVYSLFSFYQKAEQNAVTLVGLTGYQKAGRDAVIGTGLVGYQKAGQDAITGIGIAGYQQAGQDAITGIGLTGYQEAKSGAKADIAIALYQRVGEKTRAFGAFSRLTKD